MQENDKKNKAKDDEKNDEIEEAKNEKSWKNEITWSGDSKVI